jgi:RHS repeat-associated protein
VEQVSTGGTVLYVHHDQQGSTRLLTGTTGKVEGSFTYAAYGALIGHTGTATAPLGYDAQYTSADTGLVYLRARVYDPTTAQFVSVDPAASITGAPYSYASDNPVNEADASGLIAGYCESSSEERESLERQHRLYELHRTLEREARELAEERRAEQEENESFTEQLVTKAAKAIGGCLAGSEAGTVTGGAIGIAVGDAPGGVIGATVGAPVGCAVGALVTGSSTVNPLQPSEGGP